MMGDSEAATFSNGVSELIYCVEIGATRALGIPGAFERTSRKFATAPTCTKSRNESWSESSPESTNSLPGTTAWTGLVRTLLRTTWAGAYSPRQW
jgi:hypothetical protein